MKLWKILEKFVTTFFGAFTVKYVKLVNAECDVCLN